MVDTVVFFGCFGLVFATVFILFAIGVAILMWAFNR